MKRHLSIPEQNQIMDLSDFTDQRESRKVAWYVRTYFKTPSRRNVWNKKTLSARINIFPWVENFISPGISKKELVEWGLKFTSRR